MKQKIAIKNTDRLTITLPPELHNEMKDMRLYNNINWSYEFRKFAQEKMKEIRNSETK